MSGHVRRGAGRRPLAGDRGPVPRDPPRGPALIAWSPMPTVARFNVTPVKATRLHHPDEVRIEPYGVVGNREFFLVDEDGRLIGGSRIGELVGIRAEYDATADGLRLRFPDGAEVSGPAAGGDE